MILPVGIIMVETSAWIETLRPRGDLQIKAQVTELCRQGRAAWCEMIKLELWNGALAREIPTLQELAQYVILLETTLQVWDEATSLARKARVRGMTIPATDLLIFASAQVHAAEILHRDKHYDQLKRL